eukprot:scaffold221517_cov27-Tisochrysis_lutea.AAC.3
MYESKHDEMDPGSNSGSGLPAVVPDTALSSPESGSISSAANRSCISFSNSTVFCSAWVSTATSSEPRDWSSVSSRCLFVMVQNSTVRTRATRHEGGNRLTKDSSYWRSSCRCQP